MSNSSTIQVKVEESWLKNQTLYFPKECAEFFPRDCFGARGEPERASLPARGVAVTLDYGADSVDTDITMGTDGRIRPRDRGSLRRFYAATRAERGDYVVVTRVAPRVFKLRLVKA